MKDQKFHVSLNLIVSGDLSIPDFADTFEDALGEMI